MSKESFDQFVARLSDDADLREALDARFGVRLKEGVPAEAVLSFAGEHGYEFTVDEIKGELRDEELEGVTGGVTGRVFPKVEIHGTATYGDAGEEVYLVTMSGFDLTA